MLWRLPVVDRGATNLSAHRVEVPAIIGPCCTPVEPAQPPARISGKLRISQRLVELHGQVRIVGQHLFGHGVHHITVHVFRGLQHLQKEPPAEEGIGRRRLDKNLTQQVLADRAGLSRKTVSDLEREAGVGLLTLVQVLRALGELEELDGFLPDQGPSPLQLAKLKGRVRQRASRRSTGDKKEESDW